MEIRQIAGGYRMGTKPEHHDVVVNFAKSLKPPVRLSMQALETLAVIAYKQPVTVPEISEIRGVDSSGVIATLLDRKLITTSGRKQVIGRPILYKTTKEFLLRFGLNNVAELPSMEEFEKLGDPQAGLFEQATARLPLLRPKPRRPLQSFRTCCRILKTRQSDITSMGDYDAWYAAATAQYNRPRKDKAEVCLDAFRMSPPQRDCVIRHQRRLAARLPFRALQQFAVPHAQNCSRKSLFWKTLPLTPFDLGLCAGPARLTSCFQDFAKIGGGGYPLSRLWIPEPDPRPFAIHARKRASMPAERLQKIIAAAGIASRRKAEELITAGLVSVNGQTVTELGTKADPEVDNIKINGQPLGGAQRHVYLVLNKPKGHVTTVTDPEGRPTVMDLVPGVGARIYPVGRLDYLSEGLLLLTNDGALAQKLTHASSHVPKTYVVKISGKPADSDD